MKPNIQWELKLKQGQGNQCRTPEVKFEKLNGRNGENKMKREETGRKRKTGRKKHQKPKETG